VKKQQRGEGIISRALHDESEQRGKEVQVARLAYADRARAEALMFLRPGVSSEGQSAHESAYAPRVAQGLRFSLSPEQREARASWYREVRRSPSVGKMRRRSQREAFNPEEEFTDGGLPLQRPATASSPQRSPQRLGSSASSPGLFSSPPRRDSGQLPPSTRMGPSVSRAQSAYGSGGMPSVGTLSPAQIKEYEPRKHLSFSPKWGNSRPGTAGATSASPSSSPTSSPSKRPASGGGAGKLLHSPSAGTLSVPPAPVPYDPNRAIASRRRPLSPKAARKMNALESLYSVNKDPMAAGSPYSTNQGAQASLLRQQQQQQQQHRAPRPQSSPHAGGLARSSSQGKFAPSKTYVLARPKLQQEAKEESGRGEDDSTAVDS